MKDVASLCKRHAVLPRFLKDRGIGAKPYTPGKGLLGAGLRQLHESLFNNRLRVRDSHSAVVDKAALEAAFAAHLDGDTSGRL